MAVNLVVNDIIYRYPEQGDTSWGQNATLWAQAVTSGMLQKSGGNFTLTDDVDFGGNFGLISEYFISRTNDVALTGALRLAASDFIAYRNQADSADLPLSINVSDKLTFNGSELLTSSYSNITNSNIASNAAIAFSKMAALTASRAVATDGSGVIVPASTTSTELGYLSGVTSSLQTQLDGKLSLSGGTMVGSLLLAGVPSTANEAATKQYVDNAMLGISPKSPVRAATLVAGTLASDFSNGDTIDSVVLATNDRILIKNQADPTENGIYVVQAAGAPVRSTDADVWSELIQAYSLVQEGSQAGGAYLCTAVAGGTIGVDPVVFIQFSSSTAITTDGEGIEITGSQLSLELDGSTLSKSASGLRLSASLVTSISGKLDNPLTTTGDVIYSSSGATPARLGIGSEGQILTSVSGVPAWQTFNLNPAIVSLSGNLTLTSADSNKIYLVNTSASRNITFPTPASGLRFTIKDASGLAATNPISMIRASTEQIEGIAATKVLQTNWGSWTFVSDGTNWFIL